MDKKFIKLDNKYYEVVVDAKGMLLKDADPRELVDEQFEWITLLDGKDDVNQNFMQEIIDGARTELETSLKKGVKETVLRSLGFSNSCSGGWEIDHCNGRMSQVGDHLKIKLKDLLEQIPLDKVTITEQERTSICNGYKKELLAEYQRQIRNELYSHVKHMVSEDVKAISASLVKERAQAIGEATLDRLFAPSRKKQS